MSVNLDAVANLLSGVLFILSLRGLSHPSSARRGNHFGIAGMALAILSTLIFFPPSGAGGWLLIFAGCGLGAAIGLFAARRTSMTAAPQLIAGFHACVGLAAASVAGAIFYAPRAFGLSETGLSGFRLFEMTIGAAIGAITFSGSIIAFLKLDGRISEKPILLPNRHHINLGLALLLAVFVLIFMASASGAAFWGVVAIALALGVLLIVPVGGADMPVIVSMLNSYSGWAAAGVGFTFGNLALIITGALVGASGAILSYIMCKGMNRSFVSVLLGGFGGGGETALAALGDDQRIPKTASVEDAAFMLQQASNVIIVPGYGMAVAQAQHAVRELAAFLKKSDISVKYAIHPVAGRMPGHMNLLLSEANVPYDDVFELEDINLAFPQTDVTIVIGANDVTNPSARTDPASPIYGMPILDVQKSKLVLFLKRGMGKGYAGVGNELFFAENTMMLFGDGKDVTERLIKAMA